jgi:rRNA maturation RNase YbeY
MEPPSLQSRVSFSNSTAVRIPRGLILRAFDCCIAAPAEVAISIVSDSEIRDLNRQYLGVDESTDVLTFPAPPIPGSNLIGDIAICADYAQRQAKLRGVSTRTELTYLAIHGFLHLRGFEDQTEPERVEMMREMGRIGELVGLPEDREWVSVAKEPAA